MHPPRRPPFALALLTLVGASATAQDPPPDALAAHLAAGRLAAALAEVERRVAAEPADAALHESRFLLLVALRRLPEAARAAQAWAERCEPGRQRALVAAVATVLAAREHDAALAERFAKARFLRQRGEGKELLALLQELGRELGEDAGLCWARGELEASEGRTLDAQAAIRDLRRFLELVQAGDAPRLERFLPAPPSLGKAVESTRRWILQLEHGEPIFPPPFVDRHWLASEIEAGERRARSCTAQIERLRAGLARLTRQLSTVGDLRRKDGPSNRQQIYQDMGRNREATARLEEELTAIERRLRELRRLRPDAGR